MKPENNIWIFVGEGGRFPSSAFTDFESAEAWILQNSLSGLLSAMPLNQGVFDWALENDALNMKSETLERKRTDPEFIGTFTTASLKHYHYEDGVRE